MIISQPTRYTNKTKSLYKSPINNLFESYVISFYVFYKQVISGAEEEDSKQKLLACIKTIVKLTLKPE